MITLMTKDQADLIRETGHDSPGDVKGPKWKPFSREFSAIRDALAGRLATRYLIGRHSSDDIFLVDDIFPTRVLYLEILSLRPMEPALPELLSSFLGSRVEDYRIAVCESDMFLRNRDGSFYPAFYLSVTKTATLLYAESEDTLLRFGVSLPTKKPSEAPGPTPPSDRA